MKLSIIIPVFNEEKTVGKILKKVFDLEIAGVQKEIIVVDDGSSDTTASEIKNLTLGHDSGQELKIKNFKFILHEKNKGKGAAVRTGIKNSTGDYIIIQDADLEYDPEQIKILIQPVLKKRAEVVYGTRLKRLPNLSGEEKTFQFLLHYFGNRFLSLVTSVLYGQLVTDMETCYKLFPRKAVDQMRLNARGFEFEPEITAKLLKSGYRIMEIPITTIPRGYDEGKKLNTFGDGLKALWNLLKYRFSD